MNSTLQEKLLHQLHHSFSLIRRGRHNVAYRGCGSKRGKGRLLEILINEGPMSEAALVQKFQIRPCALADLLSHMEAKGFVTITGDTVGVTDAGKAKAKEIADLRNNIAGGLLGGLSEAEQAQLSELLGKLVGGLEDKLGRETPRDGEFYLRKGFGFRRHDMGRCRHFTKCHG